MLDMQARCAVVGCSSTTAWFVHLPVQCHSYSENSMRAPEPRMLWLPAITGSPEILFRDNGGVQGDSESATMTSRPANVACVTAMPASGLHLGCQSSILAKFMTVINLDRVCATGKSRRHVRVPTMQGAEGPCHRMGPSVARFWKQGIQRTWGATPPWK